MNERENILGRIRRALAVPAPRPETAPAGSPTPASTDPHRVLPAVGANLEENLALFQKNAVELRADFILVKNPEELAVQLVKISRAEQWTKVASHKGVLTDAACRALGLPTLRTDAPYDKLELEKCDAGISECDALVAQTGSVLVTTRSAGGRALSVLPPHHVVLARTAQMLPGLPEAFALLKTKYGQAFPSLMSFITGPSRTGDIERILVLGAHGPKKLTILCLTT